VSKNAFDVNISGIFACGKLHAEKSLVGGYYELIVLASLSITGAKVERKHDGLSYSTIRARMLVPQSVRNLVSHDLIGDFDPHIVFDPQQELFFPESGLLHARI
jgi:hypothetical protein